MGKSAKLTKKQRKAASKGSRLLAKALKKTVKARSKSHPALPELKKADAAQLAQQLLIEWEAKAKAEVITLFPQTRENPETIDASTPYKKSPCKSCPALAGGLCKCAVKRQRKRA